MAGIKRMYIRPAARGTTRVALESGDIRHAAMRFYQRAGFTRCAAFGAYAAMPPHAIERSVFFEKRIG